MIGHGYVHTAIDDRSRPAYSEVLADETAETAAWRRRAVAWFTAQGVRIERVLTDHGSCYRATLWRQTCAECGSTVKKTRPYRPQTNGKGIGVLLRAA